MRTLKELRAGINAVKSRNDYSNHSFYISRPYGPGTEWCVMIRVHDLSGTDYGYSFKMNDDEARAVVKARVLEPWFAHREFFRLSGARVPAGSNPGAGWVASFGDLGRGR